MKLKLIYPDIPFWRAETSRIALFLGDVEFEDFRPSRDQLKQMKTDGTFPFGQFPVLEVDGKKVAQTSGIARFCGKLAGLYPKDDDFAAAKVDEVLDLATDITMKMQPALREPDPEQRKLKREELSREIHPPLAGFPGKSSRGKRKHRFFCRRFFDRSRSGCLEVVRLDSWRDHIRHSANPA